MGFFRDSIFKILFKLKIGNFLLLKSRKSSKIPVLVFHKVMPEYDEVWPGIHPVLFENILLLLKKHYTILPLSDLYSKNVSELKNACFITFDDGYKDYLRYAYPILKKHNLHSTLFILPYDITNKGHIWTSIIVSFVKKYSFNEVKNFFVALKLKIIYTNSKSIFRINLDITKYLCELIHAERMLIIDKVSQKLLNDNYLIEDELLSFDELNAIDKNTVKIASHSLTHPSFFKETDLKFIEHEIGDSKKIIEQELSTEVNSFAFPFTKFNELSFNTAKKHYKMCFAKTGDQIDLKRLQMEKDYVFNLPRLNVHHDSAEEVFLLINGFHKKFNR